MKRPLNNACRFAKEWVKEEKYSTIKSFKI